MRKLWGITAIGMALLISGCAGYENLKIDYSTPAETSTTETAEPEKTEELPDLAGAIEKTALEASGVTKFSELEATSPGLAITGIETVNAETVRAVVQETLDDKSAENTAKWLVNLTCEQNKELNTVVIRDTSGVDRNFYKGRLNVIPACA